jgi:cell division septum initiation protein DivIVA
LSIKHERSGIMSNGKDGVITLGGRDFKRVKNGVDEAQVGTFIDELIKERDELSQSKHHIASLTKLAEITIVEAEKMANQIKTEAAEQARAESTSIVDEAKQQARQMAEEKTAEALEHAGREAEALKSEAKREAAKLVDREREKLIGELRSVINQQFGHITEQLEGLKQQAAKAQADFEGKMSRRAQESITVTAESDKEEDTAPSAVVGENNNALLSLVEEPEAPPATREAEPPSTEEEKKPVESTEPEQTDDRSDKGFDLSRLLQMDDWAESSEPQFEVEILPPIQMTKIMEIVAYLDQLPEVQNTEIIPRMESPSIMVFLRDEMNLVEALQGVPAVAYVEEVAIDGNASNGESAQAPRKIRIGLSGKAMTQEKI